MGAEPLRAGVAGRRRAGRRRVYRRRTACDTPALRRRLRRRPQGLRPLGGRIPRHRPGQPGRANLTPTRGRKDFEMTADAPELELPERKRNIAMIVITVLPFIGLLLAVTMSWNEAVGPTDLALFAGLYVICGFGITIGFHRMLTHRAFEAIAPLKAALLVAGSLAIHGPA